MAMGLRHGQYSHVSHACCLLPFTFHLEPTTPGHHTGDTRKCLVYCLPKSNGLGKNTSAWGSSPTSHIKQGSGPPQQDNSSLEDINYVPNRTIESAFNTLECLSSPGEWQIVYQKGSSYSHLNCAYPTMPIYTIVK